MRPSSCKMSWILVYWHGKLAALDDTFRGEAARVSKSTRWEKLLAMQRREDVFFIGDKHLKLYHRKDCARAEGINKNALVPCGTNPETAGFRPCELCEPSPILNPEQEIPTPVKISSSPKIKLPHPTGLFVRL